MNYHALVESIVALHQESSGRAALAVNRWLILRNWVIGAHLVEFEQNGEDRAKSGVKLLAQLAHDLKRRSVSGSSAEMLGRMRLFYRAFPQLHAQIPSSVMTESGKLPVPPVGPEMQKGEEVEVIAMAKEDDCMREMSVLMTDVRLPTKSRRICLPGPVRSYNISSSYMRR
jgi:hypothetical protein